MTKMRLPKNHTFLYYKKTDTPISTEEKKFEQYLKTDMDLRNKFCNIIIKNEAKYDHELSLQCEKLSGKAVSECYDQVLTSISHTTHKELDDVFSNLQSLPYGKMYDLGKLKQICEKTGFKGK